ncbi:MAG: chemotaxis protein CheA [Minwuia sp.]|nr:chemotaxis protein CheA [Minwuia sp.]
MDDFEQFKSTFFAECSELLADLENDLELLQGEFYDKETLNSIFRAVHSIKAGAGAFQFKALVKFSHAFEALLDLLRNDEIPVVEAVVTVLFHASDVLAQMIELARDGQEPESGYGAETLAELDAIRFTARPADAAASANAASPDAALSNGEDAPDGMTTFLIKFLPRAEMFQHANEPLLLVREMAQLGQLSATPSLDRLPDLDTIDPEQAYLSWDFVLKAACSIQDVEEVFEFVVDDAELTIEIEKSEAPAAIEVTEESALPAGVESKNADTRSGRPAQVSSIRVDLDRIDRLVNMVGELVITQSMLSQQTNDMPEERFVPVVRGLEELALHTRELQESVMAIRMQPVKSVFARMPRLVRELATQLSKKVRLEISGENTEVDKTVVEEISDPITHMIRNSLDHGLETPEERIAAGKPEEGVITLSAEHRSGRILIVIRDDGKGINREVVLRKARERGIVAPEQNLSNEEIDNLIFAAGFSTADAVTDVSGRGVGMDVVKRNVQSLGGRINIQSTPGAGTSFTMMLPLTLAVMDGMIVAVGGEKYVLPITAIVECLRPQREALSRLPNGLELVQVRGEYIPLVYLCRAFRLNGGIQNPSEGLVVLVDSDRFGRIGIVVDELLGQQQVVIKSLEANYDPVPGLSGATILGNGRVAAILDVEGLCEDSGTDLGSAASIQGASRAHEVATSQNETREASQ